MGKKWKFIIFTDIDLVKNSSINNFEFYDEQNISLECDSNEIIKYTIKDKKKIHI